jgi:hypothetical protein
LPRPGASSVAARVERDGRARPPGTRRTERRALRPARQDGGVQPALVLVDAANVVGSRPDGWWRDRPGAAARLVTELQALPGRVLDGRPVAEVVVVLEGAARAGAAECGGPVHVVHAPAAGDDALAERCSPGAVLVTADRALAGRARQAGADVVGPRTLLAALR